MAYPALTTPQKLLGCRHHEMGSSPESVVYTREKEWRRGREEQGDTRRETIIRIYKMKISIFNKRKKLKEG